MKEKNMSEAFRRAILFRAEIKSVAKMRFSENRGAMICVVLVTALISIGLSSIPLMNFVMIIGSQILSVMTSGYFLSCWRGENPPFETFFSNCFDRFWTKVGGMLWMSLKVFLWGLLFIIPGIVKTMAYFLTPYLLAKYPGIEAMRASELSDRITKGYKMEIFVMALSFFGWILLSGLTFGLLHIFYVGPYMETSMAGLGDELIQNALQEGRITQEMLDGTDVPAGV